MHQCGCKIVCFYSSCDTHFRRDASQEIPWQCQTKLTRAPQKALVNVSIQKVKDRLIFSQHTSGMSQMYQIVPGREMNRMEMQMEMQIDIQ